MMDNFKKELFDKIFSKIEDMDKNQQKQFAVINKRIDELNQRINDSDEAMSNRLMASEHNQIQS